MSEVAVIDSSIEQRLIELNLELPPVWASPSSMNFIKAVQTGDLLFVSGHGPTKPDGSMAFTGKVGEEVTLEQAYQAAQLTGLNLLATIKSELGSLDRVAKIVKVLGMVNAIPGFGEQPQVINGASDLFVKVFGEQIGKHARSAVGMAGLPLNMPVEIEMIVQVKNL